MFGFRILENFNFPYIAKSIQEFWRRWHISLSTWFRDYVYIPLGGNRKGPFKTYFNLITVFFLTGLWHGATWSFIIWGLFHGVFLIIERLEFNVILKRLPGFVQWMYMILVVMIGWVLFRIEEFPDALAYIGKLFHSSGTNKESFLVYLSNERVVVLLLAALSSSMILLRIKEFMERKNLFEKSIFQTGVDVGTVLMFILSVVYINSGSYSPFIYFRF